MDEFLSLLENGGSESPSCETKEQEPEDVRMDLNSSGDNNRSTRCLPPPYSRHSTTIGTKKRDPPSTAIRQPPSTTVATAGVDERLGIRMVNRLMSGLDLMDLITTTSPYHSPAKLSAMSLQGLCGLLVDPPSIVDKATVQGKTHLVTVGIVFHNSGTKTSSKGGAFCILTIGSNLQTGPCVSIFLFGAAYSKFSKACRAGHVVAISNPKLLPAREEGGGKNNDTSISLSVHDQSQVILVAQARDYGVCKATIRGKQPDGSWKPDGATCKTFVDTRQSEYCQFHRKQQCQKTQNHLANCSAMRGAGGSATSSRGKQPAGGNLIQRIRMERANTADARLQMSGNRFVNGSSGGRTINVPPNSVAASHHPPRDNRVSSIAIPTRPTLKGTTGSNRFLTEQSKCSAAITNPQSSSKAVSGSNMLSSMKKESHNPYLSRKSGGSVSNRLTGPSAVSKSPREAPAMRAAGDWLQEAVAKKTPPQSISKVAASSRGGLKVRRVNTVGCGFDGAVAVPKPSKLFAKPPAMPSGESVANDNNALLDEQEKDIKERQSLMAQKIRSIQSGDKASKNNKFTGKDNSKATAGSGNAFLDSVHVDNVEEVLNAKSRFAVEADAEEYAKNRRRVVELETIESKQTNRKRLAPEKENQKIQREWVCFTCPNRPHFSFPPKPCISSGHKVSIKRVIKELGSKEDERSKLNEMAPDKGGLMLGRGLEWSTTRFSSD